MYDYLWDLDSGGYVLTTHTGRFVANEIRPVFAEEITLIGLSERIEYNSEEKRPLMWAQKNVYYYFGEKIAQCNNTQYGKCIDITWFIEGKIHVEPTNIDLMLEKNSVIMQALVDDTKRRTKELYDSAILKCDKAYIAFSGGKDSVALLHICDDVLPQDLPVIFSDTDMELPDTYRTWEDVQKQYPHRLFVRAKANKPALKNWSLFGPPSRTIRWCCSVHKSTPALIELKKMVGKDAIRVMAFVGVRGDESVSRSLYSDANDGIKNASQINRMPLLEWGAHELWLYIFKNKLYINRAYRLGLPRVGCILCPESSEKYVWLVNAAYPGLIKPFFDIILETSIKDLRSSAEITSFFAKQSWQARKSGAVLLDTLSFPIEVCDGLNVEFRGDNLNENRLFTWLKPIGSVVVDPISGEHRLKLPNTIDEGILLSYSQSYSDGGVFTVQFRTTEEKQALLPIIRTMLKKASACVSCRACEAECTHGAITTNSEQIVIDANKCTHCKRCFTRIDNGCWRYMSMRMPDNSTSAVVGINKYKNFGLREKGDALWITKLVELRDNFFPWSNSHPLGSKMVEAAGAWFPQAELIDKKTKHPTNLVDYFEKHGGDSEQGWEFIWIALANNAVLVKWFITSTRIGENVSVETLADMLKTEYPELGASTIKGGLSAFKDMISKSPLGDEDGIVQYETKGKAIISITRLAKSVHPLTVLFGLYLCARMSSLSTFTVTGLMDADINSNYVSPIVAFGIPSGEFKKICEGLRSRYPDYIQTTFTHGNDEIRIFPDKFTTSSIIALAIQEG